MLPSQKIHVTFKHEKFKDLRSSDGLDEAHGGVAHGVERFDKARFDKMVEGQSTEYKCNGRIAWFNLFWQPVDLPFNELMVGELAETEYKWPSRSAFILFTPPPSLPPPVTHGPSDPRSQKLSFLDRWY